LKTGVAKCPSQAMMIEVVEVDHPVTLLIPVAHLDHPDQGAVQVLEPLVAVVGAEVAAEATRAIEKKKIHESATRQKRKNEMLEKNPGARVRKKIVNVPDQDHVREGKKIKKKENQEAAVDQRRRKNRKKQVDVVSILILNPIAEEKNRENRVDRTAVKRQKRNPREILKSLKVFTKCRLNYMIVLT